MNLEKLRAALAEPGRVKDDRETVEQHSSDISYHPGRAPEAVIYPNSSKEVSRVLRSAAQQQVPVVTFGKGTSVEGHIIPPAGAITLDTSLMAEVLEVRPADRFARVQPGVTRLRLNEVLEPEGVFFPVDPGADASLGGMAATNASGSNAVRFGVMKDNVLGLEVVLADGRVIRTGGRAAKSSAGYNLTALFIGSEGTLGVITELILRVHHLPEKFVVARATFSDVDEAVAAALRLLYSGSSVGRLELVDEHTVRAVNAYKGTDYEETPTLFLEFSGAPASVEGDVAMAENMCAEQGGVGFAADEDPLARARLWEARHHAALAIIATAPEKKLMTTDVCVPMTELPGAVREARRVVSQFGLEAGILGHIGDGNYHAVFMVDPNDSQEVRQAEAINKAIVTYALSRGGTCTGEHGIGAGKTHYLRAEHGDAVDVMRAIKSALDPAGILNPGKVLS
ncbi:MAG: FAD-binding protein [Actinomycetota bacterium]|nr:FAD-binding protein [Actinomycetota bacterium]